MSGMSIMAGELKRARISAVPPGLPVRPILARIKKSLFDILRNKIEGSDFLDLFSGSGSVGLEALSRGAKRTVFVDANPKCVRWLEGTIQTLGAKYHLPKWESRHRVCRADILAGLGWLGSEFDIIFCGAPYVDEKKNSIYFVRKVLEIVERDRILRAGGWFVAQHHAHETFETPSGWDLFRQERYGDTTLSFFKQAAA